MAALCDLFLGRERKLSTGRLQQLLNFPYGNTGKADLAWMLLDFLVYDLWYEGVNQIYLGGLEWETICRLQFLLADSNGASLVEVGVHS